MFKVMAWSCSLPLHEAGFKGMLPAAGKSVPASELAHEVVTHACCRPQAMQCLLLSWLERYDTLPQPTEMDTAMRDEVALALASILAAGMCFPAAGIMRMYNDFRENTTGLTAPRMCLLQGITVHGEAPDSQRCPACQCDIGDLACKGKS